MIDTATQEDSNSIDFGDFGTHRLPVGDTQRVSNVGPNVGPPIVSLMSQSTDKYKQRVLLKRSCAMLICPHRTNVGRLVKRSMAQGLSWRFIILIIG